MRTRRRPGCSRNRSHQRVDRVWYSGRQSSCVDGQRRKVRNLALGGRHLRHWREGDEGWHVSRSHTLSVLPELYGSADPVKAPALSSAFSSTLTSAFSSTLSSAFSSTLSSAFSSALSSIIYSRFTPAFPSIVAPSLGPVVTGRHPASLFGVSAVTLGRPTEGHQGY